MTDRNSLQHRLSVAPMMARTDRHCRFLLRLVSPNARLYTEMVTASAVVRGDRLRLLAFDPSEHPVAVQLGGSDPTELAGAARFAAAAGYDEVNLNVGCPSDRVQAGCFGAALMREPERVAGCVRAMRETVDVPVTVKTRLGVDQHDSYEFLCDLIGAVEAAGCRTVIVHARKAWLQGLSPKQNRDVPPLDYGRVRRLKRDFPRLEVVLNGGLNEPEKTVAELEHVDGVMLGRAAYAEPFMLADLDARLYGSQPPRRGSVVQAFAAYAERELGRGTPLRSVTRHLMGVFTGLRGGRVWRRAVGEPLEPGPRSARARLDQLVALAEALDTAEGGRAPTARASTVAADDGPVRRYPPKLNKSRSEHPTIPPSRISAHRGRT